MSILDAILGCFHSNYSFPRTDDAGMYVVCLDCGTRMTYDWEHMRVVPAKAEAAACR